MEASASENEISFAELLEVLKRRSRLFGLVAFGIFIIGVSLAIALPSIYRSETVILIEQQEIPPDLVRSTVTSFAEQRIQVMSQRVMSSTNLFALIERFNLYPKERQLEPREVVLEKMRSNISLEMISANVVDPKSGKPTEATIAFSLAFEDKVPQNAYYVVNELVTSFLNENIKSRTESAEETASFLDDEARTMSARVSELEEKIAKFKDENVNNRPELEGLTRDMMNRTELQLAEIDRRQYETVQKRIYLEGELARYKPTIPDDGPRWSSAPERLRLAEADLSAAEASYGETHPDVIRLRKQAEALRATVDPHAALDIYEQQLSSAREKLTELMERYDSSHPDVMKAKKTIDNLELKIGSIPPPGEIVPNNPPYVALAARLDAANAEIASFETTRRQLEKKLEEYAASLMSMPDAEAEYRALSRDYENALLKYREISAKQTEARLSQNLESERKGEKFTLIEPPVLPERPEKPNRLLIIVVSAIMGMVGGFGLVYLIEAVDDKVHGRRDLQAVFDVPPLAYIPVIEADINANARRKYGLPIAAVAIVAILVLGVIHFVVLPIDTLWYVFLRKAGL